ncbi:MAG: hypothetical protein LBH68_03995, partial [Bifidobacteriaceae bacterium]|nr:hypothetical protein [Bifidobacteriaceae bacterium]
MSGTETYPCPGCGTALVFEPATGALACASCRSRYQVPDAAQVASAGQAGDEQLDRPGSLAEATCTACGAEVIAHTQTLASTHCAYCRSPLVLTGQLTAELQPDSVVPFTIDHEQATAILKQWVGKRRYVPKDFYSADRVDKLTGCYFPVYAVDAAMDVEVEGTGRKTVTQGIGYLIEAAGQVQIENLPVDALRTSVARPLMDVLQPWDLRRSVPFRPHYLSGFTTERRDMEFTEVEPAAGKHLGRSGRRVMATELFRTLNWQLQSNRFGELQLWGQTKIQTWRHRYALVPAWLIFYTGTGGEQYFFGINGQTGETQGSLPHDRRKLDRETWGITLATVLVALLSALSLVLPVVAASSDPLGSGILASLPALLGWAPLVAIAWGAGAWIRMNVRHRYKLPAHPDRRDQAVGYSVKLTRHTSRPAEELDGAELLSRWAQR